MTGEEYDDLVTDFRVKMEGFMRGEWTLEMPREPGIYPICRSGMTASMLFNVVFYPAPNQEPKAATPWDGWWWSEPFPTMPPPPDYELSHEE